MQGEWRPFQIQGAQPENVSPLPWLPGLCVLVSGMMPAEWVLGKH